MTESRKLLKVTTVIKRLMLSKSTVYRHCETGVLESVKIGKSVRVYEDSVKKYVEG